MENVDGTVPTLLFYVDDLLSFGIGARHLCLTWKALKYLWNPFQVANIGKDYPNTYFQKHLRDCPDTHR